MDPTGRFSDRAADYVKHRPGYPPAAFDSILEGLRGPAGLIAADVGAGTGISARALAASGVRVIAIEPNTEMRTAAGDDARIEWRSGTAEATGLPDGAVDLVLCAQAFHWFREDEAIAEFHRILSPKGRLALLWNSRDRNDPLTLGYVQAIHDVNGEHPAEMRELEPGVFHRAGHFAPARLLTFRNTQTLDREGLVGRATSASYVPREGPRFETLVRLLGELFERHRDARGLVEMRYVTRLWLAERR